MASYEHAPADAAKFDHGGVTAGKLPRGPKRFGIAVARFNSKVTVELYRGAVQTLLDAGVDAKDIAAVSVPGSVELPYATHALAQVDDMKGVIMLGAVIRGETPHFDYVCNIAADGARDIMIRCHLPVGFGVVTTDTVDQAMARASEDRNAGTAAAMAVLDLVNLSEMPESEKTGIGFS